MADNEIKRVSKLRLVTLGLPETHERIRTKHVDARALTRPQRYLASVLTGFNGVALEITNG